MDRQSFLDLLALRRTRASSGPITLDPYSGPWTRTQVIHLLRRTTFGFPPDAVDDLVSAGLAGAVDQILDVSGPAPDPPVNVYSTPAEPDPDAAYGTTWVNAAFNVALPPQYFQARTDSLKAWWAGLMLQGDLNIREKMTLFWHNHFAVEADTVQIAQGMYFYLAALRAGCLGNFKSLAKTITVDPAMLRYLNGYLNSKTQPDENYGRELQELFTVGKGPGSQYTEADVKAAARVLTGHRINPFTSPISYFFDFTQHDTGNKTFSAFYGNTTITGKIGPSGANEVDDLLNMIFATDEVARFICRKIYQFFVYYEITPEVETNVITPLADVFRDNNYDILPVMETLLKSEHFYDELSMGCVIKSPLDFVVGLARQFKVPFPGAAPDPLPLYLTWGLFASGSASAGLNLLDPPVVAGWPAWYQAPLFHRVWINSDTMAARLILINNLTGAGVDVNGVKVQLDPIPFAASLSDPGDPNVLVADAVDQLYGLPVSAMTRDYYKSYLTQGLDDAYWTTQWFAWVGNPNDPVAKNAVQTRLNAMLREMMVQAEYHLS